MIAKVCHCERDLQANGWVKLLLPIFKPNHIPIPTQNFVMAELCDDGSLPSDVHVLMYIFHCLSYMTVEGML